MITKPIGKIPEILIYKVPQKQTVVGYTYHKCGFPTLYRMADTKTGQLVGEMLGDVVVHDKSIHQTFYPINEPYKTFYIAELKMDERGQGYGSKFIQFAKNLSKQFGGEGRVHLVASRLYDRERPPHVFYKKLGFVSNNKFMNDYLDDCIKSKTPLESELACNLNMYLPIEGEIYTNNHKSKFQTFINFLKRFL